MKESQRLADARKVVERLEREEAHTFITIKEKMALEFELKYIRKVLSNIARTIVVPNRAGAMSDMAKIVNLSQSLGRKSLADIGLDDFPIAIDDTVSPSLHDWLRMCPEERKVWIAVDTIEVDGAKL